MCNWPCTPEVIVQLSIATWHVRDTFIKIASSTNCKKVRFLSRNAQNMSSVGFHKLCCSDDSSSTSSKNPKPPKDLRLPCPTLRQLYPHPCLRENKHQTGRARTEDQQPRPPKTRYLRFRFATVKKQFSLPKYLPLFNGLCLRAHEPRN